MTRNYFDEPVAEIYDDDDVFDPEVVGPTVDFLEAAAEGGPALEFGVGTGRIALPLQNRGVSVTGIDLSPQMLAIMRRKPGAENIEILEGDFSSTVSPREYSLVYLIFNTIMNITTQEGQIACFQNAADHLKPGGKFVMEVMMPRLRQVPNGESHHAWDVSENHWGIDRYDMATQGLISNHLTRVGEELHQVSMPFRYVWPGELDLMAKLSGLSLIQRWSGWQKENFNHESQSHISVWVKD